MLCFLRVRRVTRLLTKDLPFRAVSFITESFVVAGGYDYVPFLFEIAGDGIVSKGRLDVPEKKAGS